jgi:hypothetical protein
MGTTNVMVMSVRTERRPARRQLRLAAAAAAVGLAFAAIGDIDAVAAGHPSHDGIVSANPADQTPNVLDGHVNAFAQIGRTMVVAGLFNTVSAGSRTYKRHNIFAFDVDTGAISRTFRPYVNGEVFALLASRDRASVYVAGAFTSVNQHAHTSRIARVRLGHGVVDSGFTSPGVNDTIRDLAFARGRYYIAGYFTRVAGRPRTAMAALTPTGRDTGRVSLRFSGTNRDGRTHVRAIDIAPGGRSIVVAGNFMRINGKPRAQLALLHVGPRGPSVSSWSTARLRPRCGRHFDSYPRDVAFAPNGRYFVLVTTGGPKGMQASRLLCDTVTRWDVGTGAGQQPTWIDYTGGDTLTAVVVDTNVVYVGGHQRYFNNSFGRNGQARGAVSRPGIAALDPRNGLPYEWNPGRPRGVGVFGMALTRGGLWVGHDTAKFAGEPRMRIAFCPAATGSALPPNRTAGLPGTLTLLGPDNTSEAAAHAFDGQEVGDAQSVSTESPWDEVRGSFVVDGTLFAGWSDGTMTAQTYDGQTLGGQVQLTLRHAFNDLTDVQAMFFDRKSHRVYYTHAGSARLYYRYFTPESRIVGTWRYTATAKSSIDWSRVSGAFVVGATLYYLDQPSGSLRRVGWKSALGKTVGASTVVAGPQNGEPSYRAHGVVLTD